MSGHDTGSLTTIVYAAWVTTEPDIMPQTPPRRIRLTRLDALRGLAAMGVAAYHMASWPHLHPALIWPFQWLMGWGWTLVDLFFVLSGYVFAHVYGAPGALNRPGAIGNFWVARVARLWPLHLVTLALFVLFAWGGDNTMRTLPWHVLMLQGFDPNAALAFNAVSWSVSIELACYAVFSLSARGGDRMLTIITVLTVLVCAALLAAMGHLQGPWTGGFLPRGGLGFFLGQLLWRGRGVLFRVPWPLFVLTASAGFWFNDTAIGALLPLTLLSWSSAVVLALRLPLLDRGAFQWLGERSFGLYMVHMPVLQAVDTFWPPHGLNATGLGLTQSLIVLLSLLAAEAAYRLVEVPARRAIRARWSARHASDTASGMQPA